jgi:transcriptional regulator with XRE-family HTH domain
MTNGQARGILMREAFGRVLDEMLSRRGVKNTEVVQAIKISDSYIRAIRNGRTMPSLDILIALCVLAGEDASVVMKRVIDLAGTQPALLPARLTKAQQTAVVDSVLADMPSDLAAEIRSLSKTRRDRHHPHIPPQSPTPVERLLEKFTSLWPQRASAERG